MFDIVKDYSAELVILDQALSLKGSELYMKICVDTEVVKNQKDSDFKHYIFNSVNPKIRGYLTNNSLDLATKYDAINFIMMSAVLEYFKHLRVAFDDEDISTISNNLNLENAEDTLKDYFTKKYGDKAAEYLEVSKECKSPLNFAVSIYTNYKSARGDVMINANHINTFKMLMGKEFMETTYGENSGEPSSNSSNSTASSGTKSGCYIATCVYQSYNCPEVWCLRRYRDQYLAKRRSGRAFIKFYYATSPTLVKWFGKTKWFTKLFRPYLDRKVRKLKNKGYSTLPYKE